ncbi:LPO_1073/Vpar_1526 family protein [Paraburkholderia sp. GAS32]|uniref:LPO_1073/Vpar_1526 family protein n=1 Tax=Paraburkholderia sp. GAS32 TaxID=3035129 RepID=UPI003D21E869
MAFGQQQGQEAGDNSFNAQAGRDLVIVGVTYAEARQIALDVFRANAVELAGLAQQTARERAEHITEKFLDELQSRHPAGIQQTSEPDFQHSILEAQKAFARSGDEKLETVLVDLLVERAAEKERSLRQLVLTQSIETMSRLAADQVDLITVIFLLRHSREISMGSRDALLAYFRDKVLPLADSIPKSGSVYPYLAYTGVATVEMGAISIPEIIRRVYPGLVSNGQEPARFDSIRARESEQALAGLIAPCISDAAKQQVWALDQSTVEQKCAAQGVSLESQTELVSLLGQNLMPDAEIIALLSAIGPTVETFLGRWSGTQLQNTVLTTVGLAIAHSNATRLGLIIADLEIWLN